jgi:REP element-mobilizing transposase RayT
MRLSGYDYSSPGAYFITVVTHQRENILGEVVSGEMLLNNHGKIVECAWNDLPRHYPNIALEVFCVMPNPVHGIILIQDTCRGGSYTGDETSTEIMIENQDIFPDGQETRPYISPTIIKRAGEKTHGVSEIMRAFKTFSARRINDFRNMYGVPVWQRSFYNHIIRGERDYKNIWDYIQTNPQNWQKDQFFLTNR